MSAGIERVVNATTGAIETSVNTTDGGVTGGINKSMNQVEKGVNTVIGTTNHVIGGAELAVNTISCDINKAMNKVEDFGSSTSKGLADGINKVMSPLKSLKTGIDKLRKTNVGLNKKIANIRVEFDIKPFGGIPTFDIPKKKVGDLFKADIPDIPIREFGRINAKLDIQDFPFDGIKTGDLDIPTVDVKAPKDIKNIDIPDIDIPSVEIPIPADIEEDDLDFPLIPGIDFIGDKVSMMKESIKNIFEKAMEPLLYEGVAVLVSLVASVISSSVTFSENYLSWTAVKKRVESLLKFAGKGLTLLKDLFVDEILPALIKLIHTIKDPILDFVKTVTDHAWKCVKKLSTTVGKVFNESFRTIVKVTGIIAKGIFHTGLYIIGTTVER